MGELLVLLEDAVLDNVHVMYGCFDSGRIVPGLVLLYSAIDIVAAIDRKPGEGTRKSFVRWVDQYMLPGSEIPCAGLDLYGARCGLLHQAAVHSDLSRNGRARLLVYAWGGTTAEETDRMNRSLGRTGDIAVHVNDLGDAFCLGFDTFICEVREDRERQERVGKVAEGWLINVGVKEAFVIPRGPRI